MEKLCGSGTGESSKCCLDGFFISFNDPFRLSGYLLLVWFLVTVHLAGGYATWVVENTSYAERFWIYGIFPITTLVGIGLRIRYTSIYCYMEPTKLIYPIKM